MLPHYSFISVPLRSLLLFLIVISSSILLCIPHHIDLPHVMANQSHDVTHGDTMTVPFEVVKHDLIEIDPLLKGRSVLMLDVQILISFASVLGPNKKRVCP